MESGVLWREEVQKLRDAEYPEIELSHMYADNCAMQLVRQPKQFDVILSDNLFGDILSGLRGNADRLIGMLPSASLGTPGRWQAQGAVRAGAGRRRTSPAGGRRTRSRCCRASR